MLGAAGLAGAAARHRRQPEGDLAPGRALVLAAARDAARLALPHGLALAAEARLGRVPHRGGNRGRTGRAHAGGVRDRPARQAREDLHDPAVLREHRPAGAAPRRTRPRRCCPSHPPVRSTLTYAQIPTITPADAVSLPRAGGGSVRLGPARTAALLFFATWDQRDDEPRRAARDAQPVRGLRPRREAARADRGRRGKRRAIAGARSRDFLGTLPRPLAYPGRDRRQRPGRRRLRGPGRAVVRAHLAQRAHPLVLGGRQPQGWPSPTGARPRRPGRAASAPRRARETSPRRPARARGLARAARRPPPAGQTGCSGQSRRSPPGSARCAAIRS